MTPSSSVVAAATSLADWARERRSGWSDLPLEIAEMPRTMELVELVEPPVVEPIVEQAIEAGLFEHAIVEPTEELVAGPSVFAIVLAGLKACTTGALAGLTAGATGAMALLKACTQVVAAAVVRGTINGFARLEPLGEPAAAWLMRGAAVASTMSVVMIVGVNRGELFSRLDRASAIVVAATKRAETPPRIDGPPAGSGRLTVALSEGMAQVLIDGAPKGAAPLTLDLPAGAHRVLLKSPAGSVERVVRVRAGESSDITESIFPGWVALTTAVDLTMSEAGQALKRDERGWAILPPGPHDIHLDNRALGVHEVRRVVVTPGDTTRLSFMPHASMISLTTNEVADVWIDGAPFGQAPLVDQPIAVGVHDVRVRSALHERWLRIRATVQPVQINVDLTAQ